MYITSDLNIGEKSFSLRFYRKGDDQNSNKPKEILNINMKWVILLIFITFLATSKESKCVTRGRFPDNSQTNCRGYTMCLSSTISYDLLCPENSTYSHLDKQCTNVTTYRCLLDYNCTKEGNYAISDGNCTSYIACVNDLNNITNARLVVCPANEVFSQQYNSCVNETLFVCDPITEAPKIFQIDKIEIKTSNFSFHNGGHVHTTTLIKLIFIYVFALIFS